MPGARGTSRAPIGTAVRGSRQGRARACHQCMRRPLPWPNILTPESVSHCAFMPPVQKGTVMHIANALTLVRRAPAQSEAPAAAPFRAAGPTRTASRANGIWTRKALPGGILLTVLILLGALLPMVF
jgi:hypothetical protein